MTSGSQGAGRRWDSAKPPVIASGYADIAEGGDDHTSGPPKLAKPFTQADLALFVARALDPRSGPEAQSTSGIVTG